MGLPAIRHIEHGHPVRGPLLRLLPGGRSAERCPRPRSDARQVARCRHGFRVGCAVLLVLTGTALVRVELTVRATEASLTAGALRSDIEQERIRSEALEARTVELANPSRIESIAGVSLGMAPAEAVAYIEMPVPPDDSAGAVAGPDVSAPSPRVAGLLTSIMRMTAGEAQVLLVGDAGLASSR